MADYCCNDCEDRGDCSRCSYFFEPTRLHSVCGWPWNEHTVHTQDYYPPYATCRER